MAGKTKVTTGKTVTAPQRRCKKCNENVTPIKFPGLNCCMCKTYYHASCLGMRPEILNGLVESSADWTCQSCKNKPSTSNRRSTIIPALESTMSSTTLNDSQLPENTNPSDTTHLLKDVADLKGSVASFEESIKFFSAKFDEFKKLLDNFTSTITKVTELETKTKELTETVVKLEDKINRLEQNSHSTDLVICGVPVFENDKYSLTDLVVDFIEKVAPSKIKNHNIRAVRRIIPQKTRSNGPHRPNKILVSFYSHEVRDFVKYNVRMSKRTSKTMVLHNREINFYAADYLTPYFSQLLYSAKDFAGESEEARVWVSNSNILFKKNSTAVPVIIRNYEELEKLKQTQQ